MSRVNNSSLNEIIYMGQLLGFSQSTSAVQNFQTVKLN
jgi:hypothetical protein